MIALDNTTIDEYAEKGLVSVREHPDLPLRVLNYTPKVQFEDLWDEVTMATRGMVVDAQAGIVSPCIPKFYNLSQTDHTIKDFDVAEEKLDGSLIHVFYYEDQWVCSSRGSFESDHAGWAQKLIDEHAIELNLYLLEFDAINFVCELIMPENRIVVDYGDEESLRLISVFIYSDEFGWEETRNDEWDWPWDKVQRIPMDALPTYLDQSGIEGVVLNGRHGRVKIKTEEYVELHRIVTNLSTKNVLEHYMEHGNVDELLAHVPDEWYQRIEQLVYRFDHIVQKQHARIQQQFSNVMHSMSPGNTRKDFAIMVKNQHNASYMFALLDKKPMQQRVQREVLDNRDNFGVEL